MKLNSTRYTHTAFNIGTLVLRLGTGILMIPHGYDKLQHFGRYSATFTNPFHLGSPVSLGLCIFAELFCAGLVVLGLFTRFATIPLIINMIVASYVIHGDFFGMGQAAALFLAGYISLLFIGPGKASLDGLMGK